MMQSIVRVTLLLVAAAHGKCPDVVSKADWGAAEASKIGAIAEPVGYVVVHHTYIPGPCATTADCKQTMRNMQNSHMKGQKWGDVGYSFCIGGDGKIYEGRGWGKIGAHTLGGWNRKAIGVCFIGDFRSDKPSAAMLQAFDDLTSCGVERGHLKTDFKLFAHRQVYATECPGEAFYNHVKTMKRWTSKP